MAKHLRVPYSDEGKVAAQDLEDAEHHKAGSCARCDERNKSFPTYSLRQYLDDQLWSSLGGVP